MNHINRRGAIKRLSALMAGGVAAPMIVPASVLGANAPSNRIYLGCIGTGGQGTHNERAFLAQEDARVIAVCDVSARRAKEAQQVANQRYDNQDCAVYSDFRELLAREDIDAVTVCTPDHWHGYITIAAAKAGKDIYCEKPLTNTIAEGRAVVQAVERYGRVLQTGSHERSGANARYAAEVVRNGRIGALRRMIVNLPCTQGHHLAVLKDQGPHPLTTPPAELDFDRWLGPMPRVDYTEKRYRSWRFIMDYGGGEMSDRGAHVIDLAQLGQGSDDTVPVELDARGEQPQSPLFDAFFNFHFKCRYANGVEMIGTSEEPRGVKFEGDDGWIFIHVHGGRLEASAPELLTQKFRPGEVHVGRSPGHHRNFLDCVKKRDAPVASVRIGYHSAVICHLLNISMQLERKIRWDPTLDTIIGDPEAERMLYRPPRAPWRLG